MTKQWTLFRIGLPFLIGILAVVLQWGQPCGLWITIVPSAFLALNIFSSWRERPICTAKSEPPAFVRSHSRWMGLEMLALIFLLAFETTVPILAEMRVQEFDQWAVAFGLVFGAYALLSIAAKEHLDAAHTVASSLPG